MTTNNRITFAQFEKALKQLGFRKKTVPGFCVRYSYPDSKWVILVRLHKPLEEVAWPVLVSARRHLDEWGIIRATEFDEMLQAAAA